MVSSLQPSMRMMVKAGGGKVGPGGKIPPGGKGKGLGKNISRDKYRRKISKDSIHGISRGDLRRLARRGGVKRLSAQIYEEARLALLSYLKNILRDCCIYLDHANRHIITVTDVIFALKRLGIPIYGFDKETNRPRN